MALYLSPKYIRNGPLAPYFTRHRATNGTAAAAAFGAGAFFARAARNLGRGRWYITAPLFRANCRRPSLHLPPPSPHHAWPPFYGRTWTPKELLWRKAMCCCPWWPSSRDDSRSELTFWNPSHVKGGVSASVAGVTRCEACFGLSTLHSQLHRPLRVETHLRRNQQWSELKEGRWETASKEGPSADLSDACSAKRPCVFSLRGSQDRRGASTADGRTDGGGGGGGGGRR
ncbi:unnamed protein product, partial [Iphiclides podalirius]